MPAECLFCKIIRGEIPSQKIFEDEKIFAFHDIHPQAPVHFLIVPKLHIATLYEASAAGEILGAMLAMAADLAKRQGLTDGFRSIINTGRVAGQEVYHLHLHILGGHEPLGPMLRTHKS